jgi:hypothetical protein
MLLLYFRSQDQVARHVALQIIEDGKSYDLGKGCSVRRERNHHDPTSYHSHVQLNGHDVNVINADGTQSHNTTTSWRKCHKGPSRPLVAFWGACRSFAFRNPQPASVR